MKKAYTAGELLLGFAIFILIAFILAPKFYEKAMESDRVSRAKKGYATLANAFTMVKAWGGDYILDSRRDTSKNLQDWYEEFLAPNLQVERSCYNKPGCWNEGNNRNLNGINVYNNIKGVGIGKNIITAELRDESYINIDLYSNDDVWDHFGLDLRTNCGLVVFYDINGAKEPNMVGKDIFVGVFTEDGLVPAYRDRTANKVLADCSDKGTGFACLRIYLKN